ncbi:MAG: hypothetical protein K2X27_18235 [Candidatus Obscuribacterales bacterium]|nr:hypothetical protein [Candidatus Obscuribacterales bacterium]
MSKTPATLMDTLLEEADQAGMVKEHTLEQAHYASLNVEQVMGDKFDALVKQIESEWNQAPEQNILVQRDDGRKAPLPKWLHDAVNEAGSVKLLKVAFWKRGAGYSYVLLRVELDSKDRPNYYNLVIGSRRRQSEGARVGKLRQERPWWAIFIPGYGKSN